MPDELEHDVDFSPSGVGPAKATRLQSRARGYVFLGLLVPFTALTYLAVSSGSPGDLRDRPIVLTTLATITGPFTGAIARNGQGCCLEFSASLAAKGAGDRPCAAGSLRPDGWPWGSVPDGTTAIISGKTTQRGRAGAVASIVLRYCPIVYRTIQS